MQLPTGTVTFLFTDIEGSTPLWERAPEKMAAALQIHNAVLRQAITANGGVVFKTVGDAFQAAFATALQALQAAIQGQQALQNAPWNELGPLLVRMGLHTGEAELDPGGDEYAVSHTKNRVARIMSAAHGGQILLSAETAELVNHQFPPGVTLKDLGEHRLKGLEWLERLYQVYAPGLPQEFPSLSTAVIYPNNLPVQLTSFIGREREIGEVRALFAKHRLVTLTGSGGTGKTRLALQVAARMLENSPGGAWLVELAPLVDPLIVPQAIASCLGLQKAGEISYETILTNYLHDKCLLLILDNCEHLLQACANLALHLLLHCPQLSLVATSREPLGIAGEAVYRVPSLEAPDPATVSDSQMLIRSEAVQLFSERAASVVPGFTLHADILTTVANICHRLDGIPLAIELAAARVDTLGVMQIAARLNDRFRLLTGGSRTALPRQRTLRASIDWSYNLLPEPERLLLQRLSVFSGGWTIHAAESICAGDSLEGWEVLDALTSLVKKSLILSVGGREGKNRFHMLETIRQYTQEKLDDSGQGIVLHERHMEYYLALAEATEPQLRTAAAIKHLQSLSQELDNFRTALSWTLDAPGGSNIEAGLRLAVALLFLWHTQNLHNEGYAWLKKGLSASPDVHVNSRVRAKACYSAGHLILPLGRQEEARQWLQESLDIYRRIEDRTGAVMAQSFLGEIHAWMGQYDQAKDLGETSVAECRTIGDPWLLAWALCRLGVSFFYQGEYALAGPIIEESLSIFRQLGDPLSVEDHFIMLGVISQHQGDLTKARGYFNKALASAQATQTRWTEANVLMRLGILAHELGEYQQMQAFMQKSETLQRETGNVFHTLSQLYLGISEINLAQPVQAALHFKECLQATTDPYVVSLSLIGLARVAHQLDQPERAARLLGKCKQWIDKEDLRHEVHVQKEYKLAWDEISSQLSESTLKQAVAEGEELALEQAVALALEGDM